MNQRGGAITSTRATPRPRPRRRRRRWWARPRGTRSRRIAIAQLRPSLGPPDDKAGAETKRRPARAATCGAATRAGRQCRPRVLP